MTRFQARFSMLAVLAAAAVVTGAIAPQSKASTVYAFAGQKVYNMSLTSVTGAGLTGNTFSIRTSTAATLTGETGVSFNQPNMDAQQSFVSNLAGAPYNPGQNYSATAPYFAAGQNPSVLTQSLNLYGPLQPAGPQNNVNSTLPTIGNLPNTGEMFTRSDVLTRVPPPTNQSLDPRWLFQSGFTGGGADANVSIDSAAEGLVNLLPGGTGSATSTWTISGSFVLSQVDAVQLAFNLIDRLVSFADIDGQVADASLSFSLDIKDSANQSVFATLPSYTRNLSSPLIGQGIRNDNTTNLTSMINGISFVSPTLGIGTYTFSINGNTTINVSAVPEPASFVMMGLGVVTMGGLRYRRKLTVRRHTVK